VGARWGGEKCRESIQLAADSYAVRGALRRGDEGLQQSIVYSAVAVQCCGHCVPGAALGFGGGWPGLAWPLVPPDSRSRGRLKMRTREARLPPLGGGRGREREIFFSTSKETGQQGIYFCPRRLATKGVEDSNKGIL
jgi:hypothetical protein